MSPSCPSCKTELTQLISLASDPHDPPDWYCPTCPTDWPVVLLQLGIIATFIAVFCALSALLG